MTPYEKKLNCSHEWIFLMIQIMVCSNTNHKLLNTFSFLWSVFRYFIGAWTAFIYLEIYGNMSYLPLQTGDKNETITITCILKLLTTYSEHCHWKNLQGFDLCVFLLIQ